MITYIILFVLSIILILFNVKFIKRRAENFNYLAPEITNGEKGISAIFIIFHHVSQQITLPPVFIVLDYIGFICVAVFFFISGYGLMYGIEHKENYLHGFFKKRILALMMPYWIVTIFDIIYHLIVNGIGQLDLLNLFLRLIAINAPWFITAILFMYLGFWLFFKIALCVKRKNLGLILMTVYVILYVIGCIMLNLEGSYTASISAFLLGLYWIKIQGGYLNWINKKYILKTIIILVAFMCCFTGRLFLAYKGINNNILHIFLRNVVSVLFIITMLTVTQSVRFEGKIVSFLGKISYELYLVHITLMGFISIKLDPNHYVMIIVLCSIIVAFVLNLFDIFILKLINRNIQKNDCKL